jgi:hypothetical protein
MRTEFQRLIDDLEEVKSTKLYENSFIHTVNNN